MTAAPKQNRILRQGDRLADFVVSRLIGQGGFGNIYYVRSKNSPGEFYAMKTEPLEQKRNGLLNERHILQQIQSSPVFPRYVDSGHTILYRYLVMEFIGPSLSDLRRVFPDRHFSLSTSLRLAVESLRAIQTLHEKGIVHRDIKPSNFLIRLHSPYPVVLIDFGLSRRYLSRTDGSVIAARERVGFVGTTKYASLNAHEGRDLGRRDDLFSWIFSLFELMTGGLPWPASRDRAESYAAKQAADIAQFCAPLPRQIFALYEEITRYAFEDTPRYDVLAELLFDAMGDAGCDSEEPFDWAAISEEDWERISPLARLETQHNDYPQLQEYIAGREERPRRDNSSSISGSYDEDAGEDGAQASGRRTAQRKLAAVASAPLRGRHKESCSVQ
jgi:serine/threonine protein kinase